MDKDAGSSTGHIEFPLQGHILPVIEKAVLSIAGQAHQARDAAHYINGHQQDVAGDGKAVLKITEPLDPEVVIAVKTVDLARVLSGVE